TADELTHEILLPAQRHFGQDRAEMPDIRELHFHVADHARLGEQVSPRNLLVVERLFGLLRDCALLRALRYDRKHEQRGRQCYVQRAALHRHLPFVGFWGQAYDSRFRKGRASLVALWSPGPSTAWASPPAAPHRAR